MKKLLLGMLFAPMAFGTNIALADGWPPSVIGTWSTQANQFLGTLKIGFQASTGQCRPITGTYKDATTSGDSIQGFYCPGSGRIHFLRKFASTNVTAQAWSGNLSQKGTTLYMGGVFSDIVDSNGEYNWQARKP